MLGDPLELVQRRWAVGRAWLALSRLESKDSNVSRVQRVRRTHRTLELTKLNLEVGLHGRLAHRRPDLGTGHPMVVQYAPHDSELGIGQIYDVLRLGVGQLHSSRLQRVHAEFRHDAKLYRQLVGDFVAEAGYSEAHDSIVASKGRRRDAFPRSSKLTCPR